MCTYSAHVYHSAHVYRGAHVCRGHLVLLVHTARAYSVHMYLSHFILLTYC